MRGIEHGTIPWRCSRSNQGVGEEPVPHANLKTTALTRNRGLAKEGNCVRKIVAASVLLAMCMSGCATMANGRQQRISVTSRPPGAQVFHDEELVGTTPLSMEVSRRNPGTLRVMKDGFVLEVYEIERRLSRWVYGNGLLVLPGATAQGNTSASQRNTGLIIALGAYLGWDFYAGGAFKVDNRIDIELTPMEAFPEAFGEK